jgi:hypothetical protein
LTFELYVTGRSKYEAALSFLTGFEMMAWDRVGGAKRSGVAAQTPVDKNKIGHADKKVCLTLCIIQKETLSVESSSGLDLHSVRVFVLTSEN